MEVDLLEDTQTFIRHILEEFTPNGNESEFVYNAQLVNYLKDKGLCVNIVDNFVDVIGSNFVVECKQFLRSQELYKVLGQMYLCKEFLPNRHRFVIVYGRASTMYDYIKLLSGLDVTVIVKHSQHSSPSPCQDTHDEIRCHPLEESPLPFNYNRDFSSSEQGEQEIIVEKTYRTREIAEVIKETENLQRLYEEERREVLSKLTPEYARANPLVVKRVTRTLGYSPWEHGLDGEN